MMRVPVILSFLLIASFEPVVAQNAYMRLGKQAFYDGDFKMAARQLERSFQIDSTNGYALFMLGYSYYHNDNYARSVNIFTKELAITPTDAYGYYYRAMARCHLSKDPLISLADRENYLLNAILDYTKAIEVDDPSDGKISSFYQNRGLTYRDYGIFKLDAGQRASYDKLRGVKALRLCIDDLNKVLTDNPNRSDITTLLDQAKEKLATAVGHH